MTDTVIETFDLTKIYHLKGKEKQIKALDKVNIFIKRGEIFGLLGPNGAGKTTLIQILTTLLRPTSGYAVVDGYHILKNPKNVKAKIALMLESEMLYYRITAYDNLKFFCKIYNVQNYQQKISEMARKLGIERWLNQYVENLSSGMKMKLALGRTLLLERDILFLDEPTLGLDVKTISLFIDIIRDLESTIIFTSHDLSVVEKLCDRIAFISNGEILNIGTQEEVKNLIESDIIIEILIRNQKHELISELERQSFITKITQHRKDGIIIQLKDRSDYQGLLNLLSKYKVHKIKEIETSLENLFLDKM
ncbi:MAG: ABC transporter ATP-binding protein [Promethearchaeota archaeon]